MEKSTFAQLPGLQKAAKIIELQERIDFHQGKADHCLVAFNQCIKMQLAEKAAMWQERCEWHLYQAATLEVELKSLQSV